jgi:hypothetical protein
VQGAVVRGRLASPRKVRDRRGAALGLRQEQGGGAVGVEGGGLGGQDFPPEPQRGGAVAAARREVRGGAEPVAAAAVAASLLEPRDGAVELADPGGGLGRVEE